MQALRKLIKKNAPRLEDKISDGKWFKGLLVYETAAGQFAYALGPRSGGKTTFHMMPYYGSPAYFQRKYGENRPGAWRFNRGFVGINRNGYGNNYNILRYKRHLVVIA